MKEKQEGDAEGEEEEEKEDEFSRIGVKKIVKRGLLCLTEQRPKGVGKEEKGEGEGDASEAGLLKTIQSGHSYTSSKKDSKGDGEGEKKGGLSKLGALMKTKSAGNGEGAPKGGGLWAKMKKANDTIAEM